MKCARVNYLLLYAITNSLQNSESAYSIFKKDSGVRTACDQEASTDSGASLKSSEGKIGSDRDDGGDPNAEIASSTSVALTIHESRPPILANYIFH